MNRIILTLITFCYSATLFAGAWVQEKGHWLNIFTVRRYLSSQFWTSGGRLTNSPMYAKNEIDEYLEYGLTKKLTIGLYLSALRSHTSAAGTQTGSNDHLILARYLLWKSDWSVLSAQILVDKLGKAVEFNIPPSNSKFNSGVGLLAGTSGKLGGQGNNYWFFNTFLGILQRYSAGNQIQFDLDGGLKFEDKHIMFLLQNYNTFSADHPNYPQGASYNLMTIAPSVVYWATKVVGLQMGIAQDFYGQNVGRGISPFVASWIQL